ncbi:DNA repair protein [Chitinophaga oryziterrae]|uniref:DNA repair protein n=2 Tax=Chitinophaga oryziterrae TaxID=1031224 RepID=A0A6N8J7U0_9BACT|nr:DNA repair protein [Chitinophaga oryziterrae]
MECTMNLNDLNTICEIKLSYHNKVKPSMRPLLTNSQNAYELLLKIWDMDTIELSEKIVVILMNQGSRVLGVIHLTSGSATSCTMDFRTLFAAALKANATRIILAHNHPSGNTIPSASDIAMTKKMIDAGKLLDITVVDHLIITTERYCSLVEEGYVI